MSAPADRFDLYEACVQDVGMLVPVLRAVHGGEPTVLGEDFCGTAAVSAAWVAGDARRHAVAIDHDAEPLRRAPAHPRLELVESDVRLEAGAPRRPVDVMYAGNFSIGEWHLRADLLRYLGQARARLAPSGVFVCDTYGGDGAFTLGITEREHDFGGGRTVVYAWEQRQADQRTGLVENAIHFEVRQDGAVVHAMRNAFVYRWRLWSIPELRDAMDETGFTSSTVHGKVPSAMDGEGNAYVRPLEADELDDSFDVLVTAR